MRKGFDGLVVKTHLSGRLPSPSWSWWTPTVKPLQAQALESLQTRESSHAKSARLSRLTRFSRFQSRRFSSVGVGSRVPRSLSSQTVFGSHGVRPAQTLLLGALQHDVAACSLNVSTAQPSTASAVFVVTLTQQDGMGWDGILHLAFLGERVVIGVGGENLQAPSTMWLPRVSTASQASGRRASVVGKSNALMRAGIGATRAVAFVPFAVFAGMISVVISGRP